MVYYWFNIGLIQVYGRVSPDLRRNKWRNHGEMIGNLDEFGKHDGCFTGNFSDKYERFSSNGFHGNLMGLPRGETKKKGQVIGISP